MDGAGFSATPSPLAGGLGASLRRAAAREVLSFWAFLLLEKAAMRPSYLASIVAVAFLVGCESGTSSGSSSTIPMDSTLGGRGIHWRLAPKYQSMKLQPDTGVELPDSAIDCRFDRNILLFPDSGLELDRYKALVAQFHADSSQDGVHFCLESNSIQIYYVAPDTSGLFGPTPQSACSISRVSAGMNRIRIPLDGSLTLRKGWQFRITGPSEYALDTASTATPISTTSNGSSYQPDPSTEDTLKGFRFSLEP